MPALVDDQLDEQRQKSRQTDALVVVTVCAFEKHRKDARRKRSNMVVKGKLGKIMPSVYFLLSSVYSATTNNGYIFIQVLKKTPRPCSMLNIQCSIRS